ncbi:hypothetical protein CVT25_002744 [Psilocybe cyanescens]|uniref:Uncharacterized protein n=1 Tax=Psilocybe cyanescens TaxID=93625 RepID=A0A409WL77_PSICY|nr:hypothetical protein CVT25_002744 [Psilocybe cyanescens]
MRRSLHEGQDQGRNQDYLNDEDQAGDRQYEQDIDHDGLVIDSNGSDSKDDGKDDNPDRDGHDVDPDGDSDDVDSERESFEAEYKL